MFPASTPHMRSKQRHKEVPPTPYHLTSQPGGRWWPDSRQVEPGGEGGEGKQGGRGATLGEKASSATTTTTTTKEGSGGGNCRMSPSDKPAVATNQALPHRLGGPKVAVTTS